MSGDVPLETLPAGESPPPAAGAPAGGPELGRPEPEAAQPPAGPAGHRPNPQLDQWKRTWYFLRKNTLAIFGLVVILVFVVIALYAMTTPIDWNELPQCFATDNQIITFHETGLPSGTAWSVTVEGSTGTSSSPYVNFSLTTGPSYSYKVGNVTGYTASPVSGSFGVAGVPILVNVTFTSSASPAPAVVPAVVAPPVSSPLPCYVCTYPSGTPAPGPGCYATPKDSPSVIAPTVTVLPLSAGALPLGALTIAPGNPYFYNLYNALLRGIDYTLLLSVGIVVAGAMVGLFLGAVAGYMGGVIDEAIMRLVDIFLSIPVILFVIVVVLVVTSDVHTIGGLGSVGTRVLLLTLGFMAVWWPFYTRIVRGQVLVVREQKYVEAARASGASRGRIVRKHIIPNSMYPVFIQMSLDVGTIPLLIGFLVFLGFVIWPAPGNAFPEWGTVSALGTLDVIQSYLGACEVGVCSIPWWQLFFPGLAIFLFAVSVNFLSDGLRDALDPRLRR